MVQAGRPALCASSETAGHEAHHSKAQLFNYVCVRLPEARLATGQMMLIIAGTVRFFKFNLLSLLIYIFLFLHIMSA